MSKRPLTRLLVNEADSFPFEECQPLVNSLDLEADMMQGVSSRII